MAAGGRQIITRGTMPKNKPEAAIFRGPPPFGVSSGFAMLGTSR
jgi:hypothetical protein